MLTISEGAVLHGGEMVQGGEADAYGHRKLGGVGQLTSELLKELTGSDMIYQQLGYLMRSGSPDALDLMVAINYAVMAADLAIEGTSGRLVALRNGNYVNVPLTVLGQGVKRVDVDALYDTRRVSPEDPPRRRQADVPLLVSAPGRAPARGRLVVRGSPTRLLAHGCLPRGPALRYGHHPVRRHAQGHGRGRGGRRLVRRRSHRQPAAGAGRRGDGEGRRGVPADRHDGEPDRAAPARRRAAGTSWRARRPRTSPRPR